MQTAVKVIVIILLILFGAMLIANGACTIEWTRQGGIVVNGTTEVTTTSGQTVEIPTKEEEDLIAEGRKGFITAMSAINIIAGIFLFILAGYFVVPNYYEAVELKVRGKEKAGRQTFFKGSRSAAAVAALDEDYKRGLEALRKAATGQVNAFSDLSQEE
jgi:hypothetical protein